MARIYRLPFTHEAQVIRWLRRDTAGSLVGASESAAPVRLDRDATVSTRKITVGTTIVEAAGSVVTDTFTSGGTWTMPAGAILVRMYAIAGGAGAGSGTTGVAGTLVVGGVGGDGGAMSTATYDPADLPSTLTVTVGSGGTGGTGNGVLGTDGGFSAATASGLHYVYAGGGRALTAGAVANTTQGEYSGGRRGAPGVTPTAPSRLAFFGDAGAAGGSISTANVAGTGGSVILATPEIGKFGTSLFPAHGGNGGNSSTGGNGSDGSPGGVPGGGGGGGGACRPGSTTGAGGAGATGLVVIVTNI